MGKLSGLSAQNGFWPGPGRTVGKIPRRHRGLFSDGTPDLIGNLAGTMTLKAFVGALHLTLTGLSSISANVHLTLAQRPRMTEARTLLRAREFQIRSYSHGIVLLEHLETSRLETVRGSASPFKER